MIRYNQAVFQGGPGKGMDAVYRWMCAHYAGLLSLDEFLQRKIPCYPDTLGIIESEDGQHEGSRKGSRRRTQGDVSRKHD